MHKYLGHEGSVNAIAFAPRESLAGDFLNGLSRAAFATAHDVSSYSLAALANVGELERYSKTIEEWFDCELLKTKSPYVNETDSGFCLPHLRAVC